MKMIKFEINKNLITLKCVLFLFFGALGSLLPFLPLHMNTIGLTRDECTIISIVAPIIALLGPLIAAPLADRLAGGFGGSQRSKTGKYLRIMIAICLALSTFFYWLLIAIPVGTSRDFPKVAFACNEEGGFILQERCGVERTCYNWNGDTGSILVKNCDFSCNATTNYKKITKGDYSPYEYDTNETTSTDYTYSYDEESAGDVVISPNNYDEGPSKSFVTVSYPHMCYKKGEETICDVYTEYSNVINFQLTLKPYTSPEGVNDTEDVCRYPFDNYFHCRITNQTHQNLLAMDPNCEPKVVCEIHDPYNNTDSLLKRSQCGLNYLRYWLYIFIRPIADIFLAAAVTLLSTAVVIATRETSTGRGDVGKQLAAGALGFAIFAPIIGRPGANVFLDAMICYTVLMVIAILILIFDNKMPLGPPEWWWHTRCGLLALPMSSVRKYGLEIAALGVVLFTLGVFWNAIDTFLPWHMVKLVPVEETNAYDVSHIIGLTVTMGALPAVVLFVFAEKVVDYCGHSNILILCFVNYIIHHIALISIEDAYLLLIFEILEMFTLHLMWITAVLYLRHLVPKKLTACGQALPVITHFCLGRCFGALFGGGWAFAEYPYSFFSVHAGFAIAAAIISIIYFLCYHIYLKPKCAAPPQLPPYPAPSVVQNMNGNGSYTPLRVYHEGRAKKGQFRY